MSIIENNSQNVTADTPDDLLLELARIGDKAAFANLWERHERSLRASVRPLAHSNTEDVVAETFTQIWEQLQNNRGPIDNFRAYAITVARNISARWYRHGQATQNAHVYPVAESPSSEIAEILEDQREISTAFANLPRSWQVALWRVEVNDEPRAAVASSMQISTNALSQLLRRAREGLREAWLVQHLPRIVAHAEYTSALPKYVRGTLPAGKKRLLKKHLNECDDCSAVYLTLVENNRKLAVATVGAMALTGAGTIAALTMPGATPASAAVIVLGNGAVAAGATGGFAFITVAAAQIQHFIKTNPLVASAAGVAVVAGASFMAVPHLFSTTDTTVATKTSEHAAGSPGRGGNNANSGAAAATTPATPPASAPASAPAPVAASAPAVAEPVAEINNPAGAQASPAFAASPVSPTGTPTPNIPAQAPDNASVLPANADAGVPISPQQPNIAPTAAISPQTTAIPTDTPKKPLISPAIVPIAAPPAIAAATAPSAPSKPVPAPANTIVPAVSAKPATPETPVTPAAPAPVATPAPAVKPVASSAPTLATAPAAQAQAPVSSPLVDPTPQPIGAKPDVTPAPAPTPVVAPAPEPAPAPTPVVAPAPAPVATQKPNPTTPASQSPTQSTTNSPTPIVSAKPATPETPVTPAAPAPVATPAPAEKPVTSSAPTLATAPAAPIQAPVSSPLVDPTPQPIGAKPAATPAPTLAPVATPAPALTPTPVVAPAPEPVATQKPTLVSQNPIPSIINTQAPTTPVTTTPVTTTPATTQKPETLPDLSLTPVTTPTAAPQQKFITAPLLQGMKPIAAPLKDQPTTVLPGLTPANSDTSEKPNPTQPNNERFISSQIANRLGGPITVFKKAPDSNELIKIKTNKLTEEKDGTKTLDFVIETDPNNTVFVYDSRTRVYNELLNNKTGVYQQKIDGLRDKNTIIIYVIDKNKNWTAVNIFGK